MAMPPASDAALASDAAPATDAAQIDFGELLQGASLNGFLRKFDNEVLSNSRGDGKSCLILTKTSGSLAGLVPAQNNSTGPHFEFGGVMTSKRSMDNAFSRMCVKILRHMLKLAEDRFGLKGLYEELCEYLTEHQISLWFEVVVPKLLKDHGAVNIPGFDKSLRPEISFVVATYASASDARGSPQFIGLMNFLNLLERFKLPGACGALVTKSYVDDVARRFTPKFRATATASDVMDIITVRDERVLPIPGIDTHGGGELRGCEVQEGFVVHELASLPCDGVDYARLLHSTVAQYSEMVNTLLDASYYDSLRQLAEQHLHTTVSDIETAKSDIEAIRVNDVMGLLDTLAQAPGPVGALISTLKMYGGTNVMTTVHRRTVGGVVRTMVQISPQDEVYYAMNFWNRVDPKVPILPRGMVIYLDSTMDGKVLEVRPPTPLPYDPFMIVHTLKFKLALYVLWTFGFRNSYKRALTAGTLMPRLREVARDVGFDLDAVPHGVIDTIERGARLLQLLDARGVLHEYFSVEHYLDFIANIDELWKKLIESLPTRAIAVLDTITAKGEAPDGRVGQILSHFSNDYIETNKFSGEPGTFAHMPTPPKTVSEATVVLALTDGQVKPGTQKMLARMKSPTLTVDVSGFSADSFAAWIGSLPALPAAPPPPPPLRLPNAAVQEADQHARTVLVVMYVAVPPGSGKSWQTNQIERDALEGGDGYGPIVGFHAIRSDVVGSKKFYPAVENIIRTNEGDLVLLFDRNFPDYKGVCAGVNQMTRMQQAIGFNLEFVLIVGDIDIRENISRISNRAEGEHGMPSTAGFEDIVRSQFYKPSVPTGMRLKNSKIAKVEFDFYSKDDLAWIENVAKFRGAICGPALCLETTPESARTTADEVLAAVMPSEQSMRPYARVEFDGHHHCTLMPPNYDGHQLETVARCVGMFITMTVIDHVVLAGPAGLILGCFTVDDSQVPKDLLLPEREGISHITDTALLSNGLPPAACNEALMYLKRTAAGEPAAGLPCWKVVKRTPVGQKITGKLVY